MLKIVCTCNFYDDAYCDILLHNIVCDVVNPLTAVHIRFLHFSLADYIQLLNLLEIKSDIKQQDLKLVDLHFVKSE